MEKKTRDVLESVSHILLPILTSKALNLKVPIRRIVHHLITAICT
jgi:hypothetical protein